MVAMNALVITVSDRGSGFGPRASVASAADPERLLMESGRGLTMMVTMMDEVIYGRGGRRVRLIKNLPPTLETATSRGECHGV